MSFAQSREKAVFLCSGKWVLLGPRSHGGGPMARLPRLIGRGRALEVLLGSDDIRGELAGRYGYVNRSLPDAELDAFVDALATRIACVRQVGHCQYQAPRERGQLAARPVEIAAGWDACMASIARPAAHEKIKRLFEEGFHKPGDAETRLGYYVGQLGLERSTLVE